jgi:hypothetical protein
LWSGLDESVLSSKLGSLEGMFAKSAAPKAGPASSAIVSPAKRGPVTIVDGKRQQNTGIMLGRLRLENEQIKEAVRDSIVAICACMCVCLSEGVHVELARLSQITSVDLSVLTLDKVKMIIDSLLPASEEEAVISYSGPLDELSKVDQYYFTMAQIPRWVVFLKRFVRLIG